MNNNLQCIEIKWSILGAKLARLSNIEQTSFLKSFAQEMNKYETRHQRDLQLFYIKDGVCDDDDGLSYEEREVFKELGTK